MHTERLFATIDNKALADLSGGGISAACAAGGVVGATAGFGLRRDWQFLASTAAGCAAGEGVRSLYERYAGEELKHSVGAVIRYLGPRPRSGL